MEKFLRTVLAVFLFSLLAGCIPSVHPLYTGKDLVFEPALVGTWAAKEGDEVWTFTKGEGDAYILECRDKDGRDGKFAVHLLKVGDQRFIDLYPVDLPSKRTDFYKTYLFPVHTFLRVQEIGKGLKMQSLDPEWLTKFLKEHPNALKHEVVQNSILLTAQPEALQAFVLKNAETEGAWMSLEPLQKR